MGYEHEISQMVYVLVVRLVSEARYFRMAVLLHFDGQLGGGAFPVS
jgi:hypothetical protein